jgi:RHS repeat-associated protein
MFNGQVLGEHDNWTGGTVTYLHGDHLGSVSLATNGSGAVVSKQDFDPWGKVRGTSAIGQTSLNYTGQRLDGTGLLYYHARYYDPVLARFVSADSIVPGSASGGMDGVALKSLTVDFHEPGFGAQLAGENTQPFWFQMSDEQRQQAGSPWGPANAQALNRYSYVQNNPLRWTDPSGHCPLCRLAGPLFNAIGKYAGRFGSWAGSQLSRFGQWIGGLSRATTATGPTINFLENQLNRVNHILQGKHNWDKLVQLSGNAQQDYKAIQPLLSQAMSTAGTQISTNPQGQAIMEFTTTIKGHQVVVRALQIAQDVYQITDAWVK